MCNVVGLLRLSLFRHDRGAWIYLLEGELIDNGWFSDCIIKAGFSCLVSSIVKKLKFIIFDKC